MLPRNGPIRDSVALRWIMGRARGSEETLHNFSGSKGGGERILLLEVQINSTLAEQAG